MVNLACTLHTNVCVLLACRRCFRRSFLSFDDVNFCFACSSTLDGISFSLCGGLAQGTVTEGVCVYVYVSSITYMYVHVYVIITEVQVVVVASPHSANCSRHVIWHYVCPDIQWNGILISYCLSGCKPYEDTYIYRSIYLENMMAFHCCHNA